MKESNRSHPSSPSRNTQGEPSPVDTYFQQLTSIDLEFFKELPPVYSSFNQTIVRAIIRDVCKLERTGFQCIKRVKKSPRTSLPLQSDWLKLIEEKEHANGPGDVVVRLMDRHHKESAPQTHHNFSHRLA
ncbi:hypothetical protein PCASD_12973 [Puccinia coronata f. sp. avenae]|uniref:Uncharacterized protein n=1 Tax=Puccinia coronata f. sp. avenae TaxID=200324 RepID=A0A2N5UAK5_9BASI|nr:hypothetical protein PCASD_12973 [Puccinia coronata f. sp. avenae]